MDWLRVTETTILPEIAINETGNGLTVTLVRLVILSAVVDAVALQILGDAKR